MTTNYSDLPLYTIPVHSSWGTDYITFTMTFCWHFYPTAPFCGDFGIEMPAYNWGTSTITKFAWTKTAA